MWRKSSQAVTPLGFSIWPVQVARSTYTSDPLRHAKKIYIFFFRIKFTLCPLCISEGDVTGLLSKSWESDGSQIGLWELPSLYFLFLIDDQAGARMHIFVATPDTHQCAACHRKSSKCSEKKHSPFTFNNYAMEAFMFELCRFLLKPIDNHLLLDWVGKKANFSPVKGFLITLCPCNTSA